MFLDRLPRPLRLALYALATAILLWLCLSPSSALPGVTLWDKVQHAVAWFVLTAAGLLLSHRRPLAIAAYALGVGVAVEALQATMGFGRQGDWIDLAADSLGVATALALYAVVQRLRRR